MHPPSPDTTQSTSGSVSSLRSAIAAETSVIFTEKRPPKPQHSSWASHGTTSAPAPFEQHCWFRLEPQLPERVAPLVNGDAAVSESVAELRDSQTMDDEFGQLEGLVSEGGSFGGAIAGEGSPPGHPRVSRDPGVELLDHCGT